MRWPPYTHIFFDCDSTLTAVEGIDVLADAAGKGWRVQVLTRAAMNGDLELEEVYAKRLQAVKPTRGQINAIRQVYKQNVVEDAASVIKALQALGHYVYIVSGGLAEPVSEFGVYLGVPRQNILAVAVQYNELSGTWWQNDEEIPNIQKKYRRYREVDLASSNGKAAVIRRLLREKPGRALLVGDGNSDLLAGTDVDLFVGYGGVISRPRVLAEAPCFLHTRSLAPLLALAAGPALLSLLERTPYAKTGEKALDLIKSGAITFTNERLGEKFRQAYQAVYSRTH